MIQVGHVEQRDIAWMLTETVALSTSKEDASTT